MRAPDGAFFRDWCCWSAILAGFLLPSYFALGYSPASLELWAGVVASAVAATLFAWLFPVRTRRMGVALAAVLSAYVILYFGVAVLALAAALGVSLMALFHRRMMQVVAAAALLASGAGTVLDRGSVALRHTAHAGGVSERPSVIHIVLDEQASAWGVPDSVDQKLRRKFSSFYSERGFTVFERSFSVDRTTGDSFARFLNPGAEEKDAVHFEARRETWVIDRASLWQAAAKNRRLDITDTYFDVAPALAAHDSIARLDVIDAGVPYPLVREQGVSSRDRLLISLAGVAEHLHVNSVIAYIANGLKAAGVAPGHTTGLERAADFIYTASRVNPLASARALDAWTARLAKDGERGTYYYFHAILPHFPYLFTAECELRPVASWRGRGRWLGDNTRKSREDRYRLYAEQVMCTQRHIARVLAALETNPRLRDAVVIIHGDHGARISYRDAEFRRWLDEGGTPGEFERDWRAAFFAVRFPDTPGKDVMRPAAIHDALADLVSRDFRSLDLTALPTRKDRIELQ
jgi:hypothetical protein